MALDVTALDAGAGGALARLAADTVAARLAGRPFAAAEPSWPALTAVGAAFVTLEAAGRLRGCVGTVEPVRPLYLDVIRNAERAMRDPRLPPLTGLDWPDLDVKVSVLTPLRPLPARTFGELLGALRPGADGLVLFDESRRATFLPAVWRKLNDPAQFVVALLAKGGWPLDEWPAGLSAARYTSIEFRDPAPRPPQSFLERSPAGRIPA